MNRSSPTPPATPGGNHRPASLAAGLAALALASATFAACSAVEPDGAVKAVLEDDVFGGRGEPEPIPPPDATRAFVPPPGGPVRWKMRF